jgi:glutathione S-transferase
MLKKLGAAPTSVKPDGNPFYTVPVISDSIRKTGSGEPTIVSDSWNIAIYLEETYPKPALFPPGSRALQALFQEYILKNIHMTFYITLQPQTHHNLNEKSAV